jgi:hypothetical protein
VAPHGCEFRLGSANEIDRGATPPAHKSMVHVGHRRGAGGDGVRLLGVSGIVVRTLPVAPDVPWGAFVFSGYARATIWSSFLGAARSSILRPAVARLDP